MVRAPINSIVDTDYKESDSEMMALQWFGKENVAVGKVLIPAITNATDVMAKITDTEFVALICILIMEI
ncbi:unnamed protein product [Debaryomyces tyrocola]|nr:unnamed protein product [Debaryomyces tyrocola]